MKNLPLASVMISVALPVVLAPVSEPVSFQANTTKGGPFPRQITLFDRTGAVVRTLGTPGSYASPALSPDGARLAIVRPDPAPSRRPHIWVFDVSTGHATQITFDPAGETAPVWSPDGSQIAFTSRRNNRTGLYRKVANGTGSEELLYQHTLGAQTILTDWSPDGRFLSFHSGGVLYVVPLSGAREAVELIREEYEAYAGRFSADSRLLAYVSDESGRNEVYVRAFDPSSVRFSPLGMKWQVSREREPIPRQDDPTLPSSCYEESVCVEPAHWRQDGKELLYVATDGTVMAAEITITPTFQARTPMRLFRAPGAGRAGAADYFSSASISRDGQIVAFAVSVVPTRNIMTVKPEVLATYAGKYVETANNRELMVALQGDHLLLQIGQRKLPLVAESSTYFFSREISASSGVPTGDRDVEFVTDNKGGVTHLLMYFGGPAEKWTRQ